MAHVPALPEYTTEDELVAILAEFEYVFAADDPEHFVRLTDAAAEPVA